MVNRSYLVMLFAYTLYSVYVCFLDVREVSVRNTVLNTSAIVTNIDYHCYEEYDCEMYVSYMFKVNGDVLYSEEEIFNNITSSLNIDNSMSTVYYDAKNYNDNSLCKYKVNKTRKVREMNTKDRYMVYITLLLWILLLIL